MQIKEVVIVAAVRTPIGSFGGALASLSATELGAVALKGALDKAGVAGSEVDQVIMGNVISANLGQAPARQAAKKAGLPDTVECTTVNKVCASGTKAIMFGAQAIMLGQADVILAGGMESMSNVPYYLDKARFGAKYGHGQMIDGLMKDGLWDPYHDFAMGVAADRTAAHYGITREEQDAFAQQSYERSAAAAKAGKKKDEIVPVTISVRGKEVEVEDEEEYTKVGSGFLRNQRGFLGGVVGQQQAAEPGRHQGEPLRRRREPGPPAGRLRGPHRDDAGERAAQRRRQNRRGRHLQRRRRG